MKLREIVVEKSCRQAGTSEGEVQVGGQCVFIFEIVTGGDRDVVGNLQQALANGITRIIRGAKRLRTAIT